MRWFLVAVLAYGLLVLQVAVFGPGRLAVAVEGHWVRPDLVFILGLFLALYFQPAEVFIAGWCLGLASDLASVTGRLGARALLFALALYLISRFRVRLLRGQRLTPFLLALASVFIVHLLWYFATRLLEGSPLVVVRTVVASLLDALYSSIFAPYLIWLLQRLRGPLGAAGNPVED